MRMTEGVWGWEKEGGGRRGEGGGKIYIVKIENP